ncbi:SH3 domain protein [Natronospira proteinivora]|uniref:SH3 domain protein n=1 Tax=Natronospira proteinivora TaxID=1807133 RepID=A0ABT1GBE2_9GAMM|nr:TIGR04211 family SH3 domain-containing protein [Natronospira proteinivora]MCP1728245.1 SH3 domain protein [Natronospira proteinivora]
MRTVTHVSALLLSLMLALPLGAQVAEEDTEAAWVNDQLFLSLYPEPDSDSDRLTLLNSGDRLLRLGPVEDGFAEVETEDGTRGWVNEDFLVESPPARVRISEVESERDELADTVSNQAEELSSLRQTRDQLSAERDELRASLDQGEAEQAVLHQRIDELQQALDDSQDSDSLVILDTRTTLDLPEHLDTTVAGVDEAEASPASETHRPEETGQLGDRMGPVELGITGLVLLMVGLLGGLVGYLWREKKIRQRFGGLSL